MPPKLLQARLQDAVLAIAQAANSAVAQFCPEAGATMLRLPGCTAFFYGSRDLATRAILFDPDVINSKVIDDLESFFLHRGGDVRLSIANFSRFANLITHLEKRGYRDVTKLCTWWRPLPVSQLPATSAGIKVTSVTSELLRVWAQAVATGFRESDSALDDAAIEPQEVRSFRARATIQSCRPYLATLAGEPAGGAMLQMHDGVALIRTASTRFAHRRKGIQQALIAARLRAASEAGCDVAFSMADKGSWSEHNLRRFGFEFLQEGCILSKPEPKPDVLK
jgi:hypothetical protein